MKKIIGYFSSSPTWNRISEKEYRKQFTHDLAIYYLKYEIFESIEREMTFILKDEAVGFYAGLRFLFPEVNHLAHLYWGHRGGEWRKLETRLTSLYMKRFCIFIPDGGIYYLVFRHGLMHSHHPKWVKKDKRIGWYISNREKLEEEFSIFIPEFTEKVKLSIEKFITELEIEKKNNKRHRLNNFLDAIADSGKILQKKDLRLYYRKKKKRKKV